MIAFSRLISSPLADLPTKAFQFLLAIPVLVVSLVPRLLF
jgi:hypothetical protein